jgi:hypothetical protein
MKPVLKYMGLGFLTSGTLAGVLLAIGIAPLIGAYVLSGSPTAMLLEGLVPSSFFYWLVPDGGAPGAVGLFMISAFIQWGFIFTLLYYWRHRWSIRPNN